MKDYKLSEIQAICEARTRCIGCKCTEECNHIRFGGNPSTWSIEKEKKTK